MLQGIDWKTVIATLVILMFVLPMVLGMMRKVT